MSDKKALDKKIISYMVKTMGKSRSVCEHIFNCKTAQKKNDMRFKHLFWMYRDQVKKKEQAQKERDELKEALKKVANASHGG